MLLQRAQCVQRLLRLQEVVGKTLTSENHSQSTNASWYGRAEAGLASVVLVCFNFHRKTLKFVRFV